MIEHELVFLGLLMDRPKHGYDIKRQIEDELVPYVGLEIKSIYYPLKKMEEEGLVKKEAGREGNWPEKYTYSITPKGKKKFDRLILKSFYSVDRPFFQIDLSLYFLQYLDRNVARKRLKARLVLLQKIHRHLSALSLKIPPIATHLPFIVEHDLALVNAEIASATQLIEKL